MNSREGVIGAEIRTGAGAPGVATAIRLSIVDGRIPVGAKFPSERALSSQLGISRGTVVRALSSLRIDGWVTTRHGSGSYAALPATVKSREAPWSLAALSADGIIDLTRAVTSAPHDAYLAAVDRARSSLPRLLIGAGLSDQGLPELRELIASRYTADGVPTASSQIIITSGARSGIELVFRSLHNVRRRIAVETPTFPGTLELLRRSSTRLVPMPVVDGRWTQIHEVFRSGNADLAHLTPDFHNPTGSLMTAGARQQVAQLAEAHGVILCVDETQRELNLSDQPVPPPLHGRGVVNLGSMSKSFWGGSRIGWIRCTAPLAHRIQASPHFSLLTSSPLEQLVAHELMSAGDDAVRLRVRHLREQRDLLMAKLTRWAARPSATTPSPSTFPVAGSVSGAGSIAKLPQSSAPGLHELDWPWNLAPPFPWTTLTHSSPAFPTPHHRRNYRSSLPISTSSSAEDRSRSTARSTPHASLVE